MTPAHRPAVVCVLVAVALAAVGLPGIAVAQAPDGGGASAAQPLGTPQPDKSVRDPDFGVTARHLGLERHVEMYQWQQAGQGYAHAWSERPLDSSGFAAGHDNPPFPLQGKRWRAASISIDGKPLDDEVLRALGQWRGFRPSFNALPGNLAATFQPLGDGLGSGENPLDPQVGDLRITWSELILPPLQGRVVLNDGHWQLVAAPAVVTTPGSDAPIAAGRAPGTRRLPWLLGGGVLLVLIAGLAAWRRRRKP